MRTKKQATYNQRRDHYMDDNGNYVYLTWFKDGNGQWRRTVQATIPCEDLTAEIIAFLNESDYDIDLAERYDRDNTDSSRGRSFPECGQSEHRNDSYDRTVEIEDGHSDIFSILFPEIEVPSAELLGVERFIMEKLTLEQQNLFYAHMGEMLQLEEIRRREELVTGKKVSKQAVHNRWKKIIVKACKEFGVEVPKQKRTGRKEGG